MNKVNRETFRHTTDNGITGLRVLRIYTEIMSDKFIYIL